MALLGRRTVTHGVLIDIGSGSVGIGIVTSHRDEGAPELIFAHREAIRIGAHPTTADRIRAMRHALFSAVVALNQDGLKRLTAAYPHAKIEKMLVVCGAPWSRTVTRFIHMEEKEPFIVTAEKMAELVAAVEKQDIAEAGIMSATKDLHVELTERAVVSTLLNGYLVHEPEGKEATELTLAHISGLVPKAVLEAASEIEKGMLHHAKESIHTYALILYCVLRDLYPHTKHAFLIDISGEATEINLMRDQVLYATHSIPFGQHTIARKIAHILHTIPEEAKGHMEAYARNETTENVKKAVEKAIAEYSEALRDAYEHLARTYVLPKQVFVTVDENLAPFFTNILNAETSKISTIGELAVTVVGKDTSAALARYDEGVDHDLFLSIAARFFHKVHGCGETL